MKYNEGTELYFKNYANKYIKCKIVKVLEKTQRYRVVFLSSWNNNEEERVFKESELFVSENDGIDSEIRSKQIQIEYLNKEIQTLEQQRKI